MEKRWEFQYEHEANLTRVGHVKAVVTLVATPGTQPRLRVKAHYFREGEGAAFDLTVEEKKFRKQCEHWALAEVRDQFEPQT